MPGDLKVSSYVTVRDRCPMRFRVNSRDEVEFSFGGRQDPFEFEFSAQALREFLWLGSKALEEMAAQDEERGPAPAI
jgi:hypothetical protein